MKYALLIYAAPDAMDGVSDERRRAITEEYMALLTTPGVYASGQLQPAESATTVRVENGRPLITDGPFPEMKELLGGFYLLEADDIDGALELATRMPAARMGGAVEVRPLVER
jgi:hypothetical protein